MKMYEFLKNTVPTYSTPREFLTAVVGYFEWVEDHPLVEETLSIYKGEVIRADANKCRAYTKTGLASFLNIPQSRVDSYKRRGGEWLEVCEMIDQVIYEQKFTNAAAGLLNSNIISRDLGLAEKKELGGLAGAPPVSINITPVAPDIEELGIHEGEEEDLVEGDEE